MEKIHRKLMDKKVWMGLVEDASKPSFELLRGKSPIMSKVLGKEILVSKLFFNHIVHSTKRKNKRTERLERLLILPIIPEILNSGCLVENRIDEEKNDTFFRVEKKFRFYTASVIVRLRDGDYTLFSCFIVKKRVVLVSDDRSPTQTNA